MHSEFNSPSPRLGLGGGLDGKIGWKGQMQEGVDFRVRCEIGAYRRDGEVGLIGGEIRVWANSRDGGVRLIGE